MERQKFEEFEKNFNEYFITFKRSQNNIMPVIDTGLKEYISFYKRLILRNKGTYIQTAFLSVFIVFVTLFSSFIYKEVIDSYTVNDHNGTYKNLIFFLMLLFIMNLLRLALLLVKGFIISCKNRKLSGDLTNNFINKVLKKELSFFETHKIGDFTGRYNAIEDINNLLINIPDLLIYELISIIIYMCFLVHVNKRLFVATIMVLFMYCLLILFFMKIIHKILLNLTSKYAEIVNNLKEIVSAIQIIKSLTAEHYYGQRFIKKVDVFLDRKKTFENLFIVQDGVQDALQIFGELAVWAIGIKLLSLNNLTLGTLILYINVMSMLLEEVDALVKVQKEVQSGIVAVQRMEDIYVADDEECTEDNSMQPISIDKILFEDVYFRYGYGNCILQGINLSIFKGETLGIIGKSGSGKTTLFKLLLKYYSLEKGCISINGINIAEIPVQAIRNSIYYVPQEPVIFRDTIKNNLLCGKEHAETKLEKVIQTCDMAEIIEKLPEGIESQIDDDFLSSGEKQRIGLARILINSPRVLIMDESTSNLDTNTSKLIMDSIKINYPKTICIHIVHRLEILDYCDFVYKMTDGHLEICQ